MKRGKKTRVSGTSKGGKEPGELAEEDKNSKFGYRSITELPRYLSIDILLRLSVNRLLVCRCVCKTWRSLICDPEFAKLHFAKGEVYPLIRFSTWVHVSRTLYLVEPSFNYKSYYHSYSRGCICYKYWHSCEVHCKRKLETKLKIPLRNLDLALKAEHEADANIHSATCSKQERCIELSAKDHGFNIVNICHGLICLSEPSRNEPVAVCNPITGEYINLPIPTQAKNKDEPFVDCALGFSPQANQYKVIRMYSQENCHQLFDHSCREAEIHVLGTSSWRSIGQAPYSYLKLGYPTFLNGALHWVYFNYETSDYLISFDLVSEKFQPIPPPQDVEMGRRRDITLGVLRGCLSMCYYKAGEIFVWVMVDYGDQRSWTQKHRLTATTSQMQYLEGYNIPISVLSNGGVLLFHCTTSSLLVYNPEGSEFKYLKFRGEEVHFDAIQYVPSFISLKDVLAGGELEVMNIYSRCTGLKLLGETKTLYLQEAHHAVMGCRC